MKVRKQSEAGGCPLRGKRWAIDAGAVPASGIRGREQASPEELAELAVILDLEQCESLAVTFAVRPLGQGRFQVKGSIIARIVQACTVSLEPIASYVDEAIDCEFWPSQQIEPGVEDTSVESLMADGPEPIIEGKIEIGRLAFETLSVNIDPYPRKPDVHLDWRDSQPGGGAFAELARLKGKTSR